ncbi:O-antigen ligase family protein [Pseudogracilibacillus auburnensis]|uniref:O-antigen ligase family protein n=1 Tax=Pseudogracilibacillus auburnensis TaxID=1494959 RepID=UPI001A96A912|nr:O-antigen ligase family protein [Pseudogracilibacillus auburnensis]MBO1001496.1 hypothetical protein [Pseudogracilibacillus auburnensis]
MIIYPINKNDTFLKLIAFTISTSAFVLFEPAPYEFIITLVLFVAFFYGYTSYGSKHFWPMTLLVLFIQMNLISSFFVTDVKKGILYFFITCYLIISWVGIAGLSAYFQERLLPYVFNGYMIASVVSVVIGIGAYSQIIPGVDFLLKFDRVQGFFKDPNVFGPFLVPPALYALWKSSILGFYNKKGYAFFSSFLILTTGILLSFSRAAWGHYILAITIYLFIIKKSTSKRLKLMLLLLLIVIPVLIYFVTSTNISDLFFDRLSLQEYDNTRFQNQANAVDNLIRYPFGFGPGQADVMLEISTHSLYVRILYENGLIGFLAFFTFFLICLGRSVIHLIKVPSRMQGYFVIITASLIGILFNSIFIDTMHWRHMWLLLALPFMDIYQEERKKEVIPCENCSVYYTNGCVRWCTNTCI